MTDVVGCVSALKKIATNLKLDEFDSELQLPHATVRCAHSLAKFDDLTDAMRT